MSSQESRCAWSAIGLIIGHLTLGPACVTGPAPEEPAASGAQVGSVWMPLDHVTEEAWDAATRLFNSWSGLAWSAAEVKAVVRAHERDWNEIAANFEGRGWIDALAQRLGGSELVQRLNDEIARDAFTWWLVIGLVVFAVFFVCGEVDRGNPASPCNGGSGPVF
jgi:hypothetical protein